MITQTDGLQPGADHALSSERAGIADSTDTGIRVFIVSGHSIIRRALVDRFSATDGIEVVGESPSVALALPPALLAPPHVVIVSLAASNIDSANLGAFLNIAGQRPRLVVLTELDQNALVLQALLPFTSGLVSVADEPEVLVQAVREAARHRTFVSDALRDRFLVDTRGIRLAPPFQSPLTKLTKRELEILRYVATGSSQRSIATAEHISVKTVDSHCTNLMRKLDIHDRVELTRLAIREGLVRA